MGRGNDARRPRVLSGSQPLSGIVGAVLDPIVSLRTRVTVQPGRTVSVSFVMIVAESRDHLIAAAKSFDTPRDVEVAALRAFERSRIETKYRDFHASEIVLYLDMLSHILFLSPVRRENSALIQRLNHRGQPSLWRYAISGDQPILLVATERGKPESALLHEAIKAHEYWRLMDVAVDLVIIVSEEHSYQFSAAGSCDGDCRILQAL